MTVPVTTEKEENSMTMRFYLPSSFTLDSLPEPIDKRIRLVKIPQARYAVIKFSGFGNESNCAQHNQLLTELMKTKNLQSSDTPIQAFYNPPGHCHSCAAMKFGKSYAKTAWALFRL
jgi:hypothetical protein